MKKILLISLIALMMVACGRGGDDASSLPEGEQPADIDLSNDSPRGEETPEPGLPPTWTPAPQASDGHVFDVRDQQEVEASGTRTIYVVQRGDTLGEIATRFGVPLADLARINNIENWDIIEVGDELIIP
jgi:LysM repeat protein